MGPVPTLQKEKEQTLALQGLNALILADSQQLYLLIHSVTGWYVQKLNRTYNAGCDPSLSNYIKYYALVSGQKVRPSTQPPCWVYFEQFGQTLH
jgi:hypothetical protein